ncbi:MAG: SdrD B-like domain-containing protein, partial [Pirellulales bacterium]
TWLYSAARVVTAGQYTNIAKVTGVDSTNTSNMVMDDDPSNHFGQVIGQPNIHIEKLTNNQDADLPTGPIIPVGQNAVFTYQVTNPGTVALASVVVSDDNGTPGNLGDDFLPTPVLNGAFNIGDTNTDNLLDTGETWLYSAARVVTAGQYTNIAKVTGVDSTNTSNMVMDDDPSNHFGQQTQGMPAISIVKTANDAPDGEVELIDGAEDVVYTYTVTNTGTTFLSDIDVIDDAGTPGDTSDDIFVGTIDGPLAPNESETLTNTIFVDMDIVNKAAAFGTPTDANGIPTGQDPVMDMDDAEVALHNKIEGRVFVEKKGKIEKPKHKTSFDKYGSYFDKYSSIFDKFKHGYGSKHGKDWDGKGDHEDEGNGHGDNGHGDNGHGDNGHDDHDDKHVKGIEGVKITLTRLDKDVPAQVTYTDEWGFYKFDWLEPGVYKVTQEQPHNFADGPNIPGEIEGENEEIGIIEYEHGVMDDMFTNIELSNGACAHGFDFVERMHSKRGLLSKYTEIFDSVWSAFDNLTSHVGSHGDSYSSGTGHEGDNSSHDDSSHDSESQSIYSSGGYSSSSSSHDSFFGAYGSWVGSKYSKWW